MQYALVLLFPRRSNKQANKEVKGILTLRGEICTFSSILAEMPGFRSGGNIKWLWAISDKEWVWMEPDLCYTAALKTWTQSFHTESPWGFYGFITFTAHLYTLKTGAFFTLLFDFIFLVSLVRCWRMCLFYMNVFLRLQMINIVAVLVSHMSITYFIYPSPALLLSSTEYIQVVQNAVARFITRTTSIEHISPVLQLHWLPIKHHTEYRILLLTWRLSIASAPLRPSSYIHTDLYSPIFLQSTCSLWGLEPIAVQPLVSWTLFIFDNDFFPIFKYSRKTPPF